MMCSGSCPDGPIFSSLIREFSPPHGPGLCSRIWSSPGRDATLRPGRVHIVSGTGPRAPGLAGSPAAPCPLSGQSRVCAEGNASSACAGRQGGGLRWVETHTPRTGAAAAAGDSPGECGGRGYKPGRGGSWKTFIRAGSGGCEGLQPASGGW